MNSSDQSISTGIGSPFTSFDSNIEADLMSSLSSCTQPSLTSCVLPTFGATPPGGAAHHANSGVLGNGEDGVPSNHLAVTMTPPISTKFAHNQRVAGGGKKGKHA